MTVRDKHNLPYEEIMVTPAAERQKELQAKEKPPVKNPLAAISYSDIPRYVPVQEELPKEYEDLAKQIIRLSAQGATWAHMAGRLGLGAEELRKLCNIYPALLRAHWYGQGITADIATSQFFERLLAGDKDSLFLYLKTRGGFTEPRAGTGANVSVTSGDVTVSIDIDRIRKQAEEQSNLLDGISDP